MSALYQKADTFLATCGTLAIHLQHFFPFWKLFLHVAYFGYHSLHLHLPVCSPDAIACPLICVHCAHIPSAGGVSASVSRPLRVRFASRFAPFVLPRMHFWDSGAGLESLPVSRVA